MTNSEKKVKQLEEQIACMQYDMQTLFQLLSELQKPEVHHHYYKLFNSIPHKESKGEGLI